MLEEPEYCGLCEWRIVYAKHRCRSCYVYRRKHGRDKSETYLVGEGERELERRIVYAQR